MMSDEEKNKLEKAKLYLEEAHAYFDFSNETRRNIDNKIHNMIALSAVLISILFGLAYFLIQQNVSETRFALSSLVLSVLSYFAVIIIGLIHYSPVNLSVRDVKEVIQKYEKGDKEYLFAAPFQHIAWNLSKDAEENSRRTNLKSYWLRIMMFVFICGIAFLVFALMMLMLAL